MTNLLKILNFIIKGTCTTNHKMIGTLYMILGGFSGTLGLVLSMAIRA